MSETIAIHLDVNEATALGKLLLLRMKELAARPASRERDSEMAALEGIARQVVLQAKALVVNERGRLN
jgi:hypothetical protein